jgi:hypothetical protein
VSDQSSSVRQFFVASRVQDKYNVAVLHLVLSPLFTTGR